MKRLALSLLFLAACSSDPSQSGMIYYPMFNGSSWKYRLSGHKEVNGKIAEMRAVRKESIGFSECSVIESYIDGKLEATEHLSASKKGIFRHSINSERLSNPICLMKFPFKSAANWEETHTFKDVGRVTIHISTGEEDITVPYGKLHALRSTMRVMKGAQEILSTTYWFGKGMGMVKQQFAIQGFSITVELESYNLGLPS